MKALKYIFQLFRKNPISSNGEKPEIVCPNCWGRQEYGGEFFKAHKTDHPTVSEHKKGWIMSYADRNLKGLYPKPNMPNKACSVCFQSYPIN